MKRGVYSITHEKLIKIFDLPENARIYHVEFYKDRCVFYFKGYNYGEDVPEAVYTGKPTSELTYTKDGKTIIEKRIGND